MVQVWNPVNVYLKSTDRVLAELRPERLQAVRALADEYLTPEEPDASEARPGFVALRSTLGGLPVLTGTPLSGEDDPRWRYQEIYHHAAEVVRLPARMSQEAPQTTLERLKALFGARGDLAKTIRDLVLEPRSFDTVFAPASLGEPGSSEPEAYRLGDLIEVRWRDDGDRTRLSIKLLAEEPLRIVLVEGASKTARYLLTPNPEGRDRDRERGVRPRIHWAICVECRGHTPGGRRAGCLPRVANRPRSGGPCSAVIEIAQLSASPIASMDVEVSIKYPKTGFMRISVRSGPPELPTRSESMTARRHR
jgi:hypothetical protein